LGVEAAGMREPEPDERGELIRAVQRGETVTSAAARLGIPLSTAYRWMRVTADRARARARALSAPTATFVEVVAERAAPSTIQIRVGAAEIEVRAGFDARLLREVVEALGGDS
jgi:transposase-like protein